MAISKSTLTAVQKTGAAAHNLKLMLRAEAKKYSDRLSKALTSSIDHTVFDLLEGPEVEHWKGVGKLSKMIEAVEADLVAAFKYASDLVSGAHQTSAKGRKAAKGAKVKTATAKKAAPKARASANRGPSNPEKLLAQLNKVLSADTFAVLKQTELSKATGIPMGSISAAIKKLTDTGDIVQGKDGGFKLGKKAAAPVVDSTVVAKTAVAKALKKVAVKKEAPAKKAAKKPAAKKVAVEAPKVAAALTEPVVAVAAPEASASAS